MAGLFDLDADAFLTQEREKVSADFLNPRDYRTVENPFRMLGGALKSHNLQNSKEVQEMRQTEELMRQYSGDLYGEDPTKQKEAWLGLARELQPFNQKGAYEALTHANSIKIEKPGKLDTSVEEIDGRKLLIDNQSGSTIKNLGPVTGQGEDDRAGPEEKWFDDNNVLIGTKQKDKTGKYTYTRYKQSPLVHMGGKEKVKHALGEFTIANEESRYAQETLNNIAYIEQAMSGIKTGALTEWKLALGQLASSLNLPVDDDISSLEGARTAMGNLVMAGLNNFSGAISNQERTFLASIMPGLSQTPEGRTEISNLLKRLSQRSIDREQIMQKYVRGTAPDLAPAEGSTFYDEWKQYQIENPLFSGASNRLRTGRSAKDANGVEFFENIGGEWIDGNNNIYGAEQ